MKRQENNPGDYSADQRRYLEELFELLRIPSISTDGACAGDVHRAAEYVKQRLEEAGAEKVSLYPTAGFPVVYGEKITGLHLPTVLVYGHYDVQPPDPLELWESSPFEPAIRDGKIFARGSCDDKGQMYIHIKALEIMTKNGPIPCNIKFIIEGEEEVGSIHLHEFIAKNREQFRADVGLVSDTSILANDTPSINVGLKGLSYLEVEVTGPNRDLHSGVYGGGVANPINVLCRMIASLKDEYHRVLVPGFYDDVVDPGMEVRKEISGVPFDLNHYKKDLGVEEVEGEKGYSTLERTGIRPTLDVNGIWGGYTAPGAKTVLPSKAFAKVSMRLVPNQTSKKITDLFTKHFLSIAPKSVRVKVTSLHGGEPAVVPTESVAYRAASKAMEQTFGKKPLPVRTGGTIPVVAMLEKELGIKTILMGFGLDSDNIHSPNECFGLFNFFKGIETVPLFYRFFAEMAGQRSKE